jgi:hypothetical protein
LFAFPLVVALALVIVLETAHALALVSLHALLLADAVIPVHALEILLAFHHNADEAEGVH